MTNEVRDLDLDDEDDLPEIFVARPARPTSWTERDLALMDHGLDLAGITDPASRLQALMSLDVVDCLHLIMSTRYAKEWIADIKDLFDRCQGGKKECIK